MDKEIAYRIVEDAEPTAPCDGQNCDDVGHCLHNIPDRNALEQDAFENWGFDRCCRCGEAFC